MNMTPYLWIILAGLCVAQGISKFPNAEKLTHPYHHRVIYAFKGGIGSIEINTKSPITTEEKFTEVLLFIRNENPELETIFITNIIKLDGY